MWEDTFIDDGSQYKTITVSRSLTPNFKNLDSNQLQPLPYSLFIDESKKVTYRVAWLWPPTGQIHYSEWGSTWFNDNSSAYQMAKAVLDDDFNRYMDGRDNRLLKKIQKSSLPLIMAWRERHETGELLWGTMQRIRDAVKVIHKPRSFVRTLYKGKTHPQLRYFERRALQTHKRYYRHLKYNPMNGKQPDVGDLFLKYEYAVRPLLMDVMDSLEAVAKLEERNAGGTVKIGFNHDFTHSFSSGLATYDDATVTAKSKILGHMQLRYCLSDARLSSLSQLADLPQTIWDSIPYSFIVDWFVNVSEWLELRNATDGLEFRDGYKSTLSTRSFSSAPNPPVDFNGSIITCETSWPTRNQISFTRQILSSFPTPHLIIKDPFAAVKKPLHLAEGAALLLAAFRRKL